jgi:hypothetical protein
MARPSLLTSLVAVFCFANGACEKNGALFSSLPIVLPVLPDAGAGQSTGAEPPASSASPPAVAPPPAPVPAEMSPPPADPPAEPDAGAPVREPDASPAPALPRPVVATGAAAELERLGIEGGEPRLGVCEGGVMIGVRTTANPSEEVFGQRLTFIEPICGTLAEQVQSASSTAAGTIRVTRADAILAWSTSDGFLGVPATVVPDPRLIWIPQPETVCPEATPVVVGLSGEYDPVAPDVPDTAAIRSLFIECAPLTLAPNGTDVVASDSGHLLISNADSFAVAGTSPYRSVCAGGAVTTQVKVHAGFWLDGFVLGCSRLRVE